MSIPDQEFLAKLRATFRVEAAEHLHTIAAGLLELEKGAVPAEQGQIVETVFRAAHSLKGAARAVDFPEIESLCQSIETVFAAWKRRESDPSPEALDALHRTLDAMAAAMTPPNGLGAAARPPLPSAARPLSGPTRAAGISEPGLADWITTSGVMPENGVPSAASVRISVGVLDARLSQAEEMLAVKLGVGQHESDLRELAQRLEAWRGEWAVVEPQARALRQRNDRLAAGAENQQPGSPWERLLDFFDWNREQLRWVEGQLAVLSRKAEQERHAVGKLVDDLLADSKKLLLLPFGTISAAFPKVVRDLCREQGKEADLQIAGEHIAIDKRILEEMKDPLIHLLRNSIDHGIEGPADRARRGKPPRATIRLAVSQLGGNKVRLTVSDDGAGIDTAKVKAAAVRQGLVSPEEAARLDDAKARALVFRSELSTSPIITQLSGRGLGLAIVQEKAGRLGGAVSVDSQAGAGTVFQIDLPAMRATFRGILVEAGGRPFMVPTTQVERVARVMPGDIRTVEGRETIAIDGRAVGLVRLADALDLPPVQHQGMGPGGVPVMILGGNAQRIAFVVDKVLDEQEILVKPLAKPLTRVRNVAAATVLGSGQVVPILHVGDLLKSARQAADAGRRVAGVAAPAQAEAGTILVAEDSITSRLLLKGILESAGYKVKTAVDGMEAFSMLRAQEFDLLVSDVEMPRLNGFDLTARVRADRALAELPVVLVTALETRDDRERGIDAGANAYVVKSSFEQGNLLDAVRRLI